MASALNTRRSNAGLGRQIPRNTLALLMIAQALVVIPHAWHLPPWVIAVGLFCGYWRTMVYQGRWGFAQPWIKFCLVFGSALGVALSGKGLSLEGAAAFLILAFALKLIEMKTRRDALVVIFLAYFTIATEFVFEQGIPVAAYGFLSVVVVTAAMIGLHQLQEDVNPLRSLRVAASLTMQAVPLMVVLFLFFPRIAPLWSVPLPGGATTGITDRVAPGDIAALIQSDDIALRVDFEGDVPPPSALYWRGLVYSDFDGATWSRSKDERPGIAVYSESEPYVSYSVVLEPTGQNWLFGLNVAAPETASVRVTEKDTLRAQSRVVGVMRYPLRSYLGLRDPSALEGYARARETALPEGINPRTRQFAADLWRREGDPLAYIDAVQRHIRNADYTYTLQPPTTATAHTIDEFWIDSRRGFCAHYAGAFVFLMRSVGIPARMVGGYQGGEWNALGDHLVVRQYDAHAWAEVWLDGVGWMRVDPTAAVAPARIESGLSAAVPASELSAFSPFGDVRRSVALLGAVFDFVESIEHQWNLWVVGYDIYTQSQYLANLIGGLTPLRITVAMVGGAGLVMLGIAIVLLWRGAPTSAHPAVRLFERLERRFSRLGYPRQPHESPAVYLRRIVAERQVEADNLEPVIERLGALIYNPNETPTNQELKSLQRSLRRFQLQILMVRRSAG